MKHKPFLTASLLLVTTASFAAPQTFTIVSNDNAKSIGTVESKTAIETIVGKGSVTGSIQYDAKKGTGSGLISISVKGIDTGVALRNDHMNGSNWLQSDKYPNITFKATKVQKTGKDKFRVSGDFSLHGVTKSFASDVTLKLVPSSAQSKQLGFKGDALQVTTSFKIKLSDYGIKISGPAVGKVSDEVTISVSAFGDSK